MPNENEIQNVVETPTMTPAEMFLQDLEGEVSSPSVEAPVQEEMPMGNTVQEVAEEPQVQMASMNDLENAKQDVIAQIIELAKQADAEEQARATQVAEEPTVVEQPEAEFDEQKFLDEFYANPAPAIRSLADSIANQKVQAELGAIRQELEPLLAQSREAQEKANVMNVINQFINDNADSSDYFDDIANYIKSNNLAINDPNSYKDAYTQSKMARQGRELESLRANQGKSLNDYLADEASVNEILNNQDIKSKIISQYLNELQKGGKPATITSGGSAVTAGMDATRPSSFDEAGRFLLRDLQG